MNLFLKTSPLASDQIGFSKKYIKNDGIEKGIGMIAGQQERALFFQYCPVVDNDLPAKDHHGQPDNYFEKAIEQLNNFGEYSKI